MGDSKKAVKLIFLHHSCGALWLEDDNGGLGIALKNENYYVSDTYYGWGPDVIGDDTDIGHWWKWFCGENSKNYMDAVYKESRNSSEYTRLEKDPGGENTVVMFKSCFPNSQLKSGNGVIPNIDDNPLKGNGFSSKYHTVDNAKGIYIGLLEYFQTQQDKLFIAVTAPPVQGREFAQNARAFNNWLKNEWLLEYPYKNVGVFDLYDLLTDSNNNYLYPSSLEDDHPNIEGNKNATEKFIPALKKMYSKFATG